MSKKCNPDDEDFPGRLLHQAALWDNVELLEDLLHGDHIAHINSHDNLGRTPLHAAATNNKSKCLGLLLRFKANVNAQSDAKGDLKTALQMSAEAGFVSNVRVLLQYGASLVDRDRNGLTALDLAERGQHGDCVGLLQQAANERETRRQHQHGRLREACVRKEKSTVKEILHEFGAEAEILVNMAPNGANTLLFLSSETDELDMVTQLLSAGADGRNHPVTKYSPLYIACYNGHYEVAKLLLTHFPELVRVPTVEKWLPIHASVIGSHLPILELLLKFSYPQNFLEVYVDATGEWEYEMPMDINLRDATGQTVLYLACVMGNLSILQCLLQYSVKATRAGAVAESPTSVENKNSGKASPSRKRIADGIQSIMSRLNLKSRPEGMVKQEKEKVIHPIDVNLCCGETMETSLQLAVRGKETEIVSLLLQAGADPNIAAQRSLRGQHEEESCSTCLMEACKNRDVHSVELLLKHGARDDVCRAQSIAVKRCDYNLVAKLLACRANPDPEFKLNKKSMTERLPRGSLAGLASLTYSTVFPNTPVMVNWHGQRCQLPLIKPSWLIEAALHLNPKLRLNPKNHDVALYAITRLDVSSNSLEEVPVIVFQLPSLRHLNLSQNKLDRLPTDGSYNVPMLEEFSAQNNRLEGLPSDLLSLPNLVMVDVSNNKLNSLPPNLWTAPALKELNVAFNLLKDLPSVSSNAAEPHTSALSVLRNESVEDLETTSPLKKFRTSQLSDVKHQNLWSGQVDLTEQIVAHESADCVSHLTTLNLAHNMFTSVPPVLACLAVSLTRLNLSYNNLRSMSHITTYPASLKQLDLSHNNITVWPSLPHLEVDENIVCYACDAGVSAPIGRISSCGLRNLVLHSLCTHRRHVKLDNLRTLVLADNDLDRIVMTSDDDDNDWDMVGTTNRPIRSRLMFPNLSMLDISNNQLKEIPAHIHELSNLSVLNLSGNMHLNELPAQLGLLSRLWNLSTQGCNLQEPLKSMIQNNKYKTMDVIGYLKSVLEDAKPYARMKLMIVGVQGIGKTSLLEQLRQEGSGNYRRRPHEHWAKRMGNKNINLKTARGTNMSTVGVDIGVWVYEKKIRGHESRGHVVFRTWDFGGQREYYATHQYFLSKRSLYLVVWKVTDGERGLREVRQWLVNIQARAPNSPVLIVGTHYDLMAEQGLLARSEDLQQLIRDRFINIVDAEKCGLPRVLDSIEVSCRTRHNIRLLCNLIYDTAYSLKPPGSKELLLEQRVPASYLALEDIVTHLSSERRTRGVDPVLNAEQYRDVVTSEMQFRFRKSFRDQAELHQATIFLHENGVLLHYEDATLRDLYFLDPQWLCDMLAHVVTVREINPFARSGVMKLSDLQLVFRSMSGSSAVDTRGYIVSLLNKFEVALTWDNTSLLIPSLLPSEEDLQNPHAQDAVRVKIPVRSRGWAVRSKKMTVAAGSCLAAGASKSSESLDVTLSCRGSAEKAVRRLLLMSYFPSGFWSRLMTRLLADDAVVDIVRGFVITPKLAQTDAKLAQCLDQSSEWLLWQTGMELRYGSVALFIMRENPLAYQHTRIRVQQDNVWTDADLTNSCLLELLFPLEDVIVSRPNEPDVLLPPNPEAAARLLALAVDHIDTLLEDWYPTLGTRFVHTSEGKFLVTRLIPCGRCLIEAGPADDCLMDPPEQRRVRQSTDSATSGDSGVGYEGQDSESSPEHPVYSWMVEECILAASENKGIVCPAHGEKELVSVAPDTVFLDLGERHVIKEENITRGPLLGRGAFGFVFRGTCRARGTNQTIDIAMKMLQPVPPGRAATQSAVMAFKVAKNKWDRDPLQYACKAYCTARQELNILLSLRHAYIVPLVGVCVRPLALVLDLAPEGALDVTLKSYRRAGAQLTPKVLQQVVLQIAKALEYLHQQKIIYRDLKSENVLVWSLPPPYKEPITPVHVKLADYGISRQSIASGSKGFGGTEGFMAPEMVRYNGEEEYTEKVDCFSFGMFLYELVTLHQPFEGHEAVKECVLEGGRPPLNSKGANYPSCILDLMVLCWNQVPQERPSASQIVSMAAAPEFVQLLDCVLLDAEVISAAECDGELWLAGASGVQVLLTNENAWTGQIALKSPNHITAMMLVGTDIWLGDSDSNLHCYSTKDNSLVWNYVLGDAPVMDILPLPCLSRVAVGLANGRLFLLQSDLVPFSSSMAEGTFVLTELATDQHLRSLAYVMKNDTLELWVGETEGYISVFSITKEIVSGRDRINHYDPIISEVRGVHVSCNQTGGILSYVTPGCMVYSWDVPSRQIASTLDCTKLVPCSESFKPLTVEDLADKCQVTSISVSCGCVYVGTAWGCIVVADEVNLYPIMVFRPFEAAVSIIVPLPSGRVALAGQGYRSLVSRTKDIVVTPTSSPEEKSNTINVLLWKHDL